MTVSGRMAPDLGHIDTWIFDLDNTLYPATLGVFPQIDGRMTLFIMRFLGLSAVEAKGLQHAYYRQYGTTLSGLMAVNGLEPEAFLDFVHDIDVSGVDADVRLRAGLSRLPGRRIVFTNGSEEHAARVLDRLGVADLIADIWDIRKSGYAPKPKPEPYRRMIDALAIVPARTAYFEDLVRNLVPAHAMGFTTVWLENSGSWGGVDPKAGFEAGFSSAPASPINHVVGDLAGFLLSIGI